MFTTENTEFTERKEHNGPCDSSVCSVDSVVKSVARLCHAPSTLKTNDQDQPVAATDLPCEKPPTATRLHLIVIWPSLELQIAVQDTVLPLT